VTVCSASPELCSVRIRHVAYRPGVGGPRAQRDTRLQATPVVSPVQRVSTFAGCRRRRQRLRTDAVVTNSAHLADSDWAVCWLADTECHSRRQRMRRRVQRPQPNAKDDSRQLRRHGSIFRLLSNFFSVLN